MNMSAFNIQYYFVAVTNFALQFWIFWCC